MPLLQVLRPTLPILIGASIMLTLSMGLRQSLGIFMQPLTHDIGITVSHFTLALAVQNLAWGFLQPLAGAMTVRYGFRPIMVVGALAYIAGLVLMTTAHGLVSIILFTWASITIQVDSALVALLLTPSTIRPNSSCFRSAPRINAAILRRCCILSSSNRRGSRIYNWMNKRSYESYRESSGSNSSAATASYAVKTLHFHEKSFLMKN